jgi:glucose-6-phosphate dehydrogenase assembly protein OpcA
VTEDLWSERDTTPDAIEAAMREMLRERHAADPSLAPARVLNLVVVVERQWKGEIANRLARVGRYHASRTVLCAVEEGRQKLDAKAVMSYDGEPVPGAGPAAGLRTIREAVEIEMGPAHLDRIATIVDPVLVSELPTVLWCPHGHDDAANALLGLIDVILVDSDDQPHPDEALDRAAELLRRAYVVDLAWLRTTPWRERIATSFDPPWRRPALERIAGVVVRHRPTSAATALLWAGWLAARLGWRTVPLPSDGAGAGGARTGRGRGNGVDVKFEFEKVDQEAPGLAGVTVSCAHGFSLSLDRGRGGLRAHRRSSDGREDSWRVLGASRGEGGILGEGVRQALLRDPTYGPALGAARGFCAA